MTHAGRLAAHRVDLWTIDLQHDETIAAALAQDLDDTERARAGRFRFAVHRTRFIVRRHAYRAILAEYLDCDPRTLIFATGEHGKPTLARADLEYNSTHSEAVALLAVTGGSAVGVDIECVRERDGDYDWLSDEERQRVLLLPPARRTTEALRMWTRKEAYVKALGVGVTALDASLQIPRTHETAPVRWTLMDLDPRPGYVACLAVPFDRPTIVERRWLPTAACAKDGTAR